MERRLARHTLDISGALSAVAQRAKAERKSDVGLPGAANNTGDDARVLILSRERRHMDMPKHDWLPASVRARAADRKLTTGEALFRQGDRPVSFFEVIAGRVRLSRVDRAGREVVLHVAGPGETLAEASLYSDAYHCDAIASTAATLRAYPKAALLAAFGKDRKAAQGFTATLARQVMGLRTRIEQRNIRSARDRVRHYLAVNAEAGVVTVRGTLKDLAGELGLTHEALYRTMAALARKGEIKRGRGRIVLMRGHKV